MRFVRMRVRSHLVMHGYDEGDRERLEEQAPSEFVEKLISVERILSATERYLLVTGPSGRQYYWEYEGGLEALTARLARAGLVIDFAPDTPAPPPSR